METGDNSIDYLPLTNETTYVAPTISSNPSSRRSSSYPSFSINETQLKEGYNKLLYRNWKVLFKIENESHTFKVDSINTTNVKIILSSEVQEAIFSIGEEKKFELTGDNNYDLFVKLNSIGSNRANFTIKSIDKENLIPLENKNDSSIDENKSINENIEDFKENNIFNFWWVLISIILIVLVIWYIGFKKRWRNPLFFLRKKKQKKRFPDVQFAF